METEYFKRKLLALQRELQDEIARQKGDARDTDGRDVVDYAEKAVAGNDASAALDTATARTSTLEDVSDALQRIEEGSFGVCVLCEKPIERARLVAVPWTKYCLHHQEQHDALSEIPRGATL